MLMLSTSRLGLEINFANTLPYENTHLRVLKKLQMNDANAEAGTDIRYHRFKTFAGQL